jgi:hypothetical protein
VLETADTLEVTDLNMRAPALYSTKKEIKSDRINRIDKIEMPSARGRIAVGEKIPMIL